jgi:hypothetical protein
MHEVERPPNSECLRDDSCAGPVADHDVDLVRLAVERDLRDRAG